MLSYARSLALSVWRLPAPPDARPPGRADYAFVAVVAVVAVVEAALLRPDFAGRWLALGSFLAWVPTLLVRRSNPTLMVTVFVSVMGLLILVTATTDLTMPDDLNTAVVALLVPFSLARWASGVDAVVGLWFFVIIAGSSLLSQALPAGDRIGGTAVIVAATAVGAALRARAVLHSRQLDDVRQLERESLARDLHDTVAHHLTAIAITAQAGLAVADSRPEAARDALRRIDEEATRTLAETRKVLRMLRTADDAPERPLDDLAALASDDGRPRVEVHLDDDLELSPTVAAAVQRIATEAVANSRRHAVGATLVHVAVNRQLDLVEVVVTDDGRAGATAGQGFGIIGMNERAELVGGRLTAGPATGGGWKVSALLPAEDRSQR